MTDNRIAAILQRLRELQPTPLAVRRPILRWPGGKWVLAPWVISHFPAHRIYVEPFGGAASVLLRKEPAFREIYNDLDAEAVNLFRVLREPPEATRLVQLLQLTPFARVEFDEAWKPCGDRIERARRLIVRSYQGFGADGSTLGWKSGFRTQSPRSRRSPEGDWANYPPALEHAINRLRKVVLESRPALELMSKHDSAETLFYVDPPYLPETRARLNRRKGGGCYAHELSRDQHVELLDFLKAVSGMVVLSGYPSPLYDNALAGWRRVEKAALAEGARERTEVLWINPLAAERLEHGPLFGRAA